MQTDYRIFIGIFLCVKFLCCEPLTAECPANPIQQARLTVDKCLPVHEALRHRVLVIPKERVVSGDALEKFKKTNPNLYASIRAQSVPHIRPEDYEKIKKEQRPNGVVILGTGLGWLEYPNESLRQLLVKQKGTVRTSIFIPAEHGYTCVKGRQDEVFLRFSKHCCGKGEKLPSYDCLFDRLLKIMTEAEYQRDLESAAISLWEDDGGQWFGGEEGKLFRKDGSDEKTFGELTGLE